MDLSSLKQQQQKQNKNSRCHQKWLMFFVFVISIVFYNKPTLFPLDQCINLNCSFRMFIFVLEINLNLVYIFQACHFMQVLSLLLLAWNNRYLLLNTWIAFFYIVTSFSDSFKINFCIFYSLSTLIPNKN